MDVNNMVAALAAKTVDAMVNVEPYNAIAEADGLATTLMDYWSVDKMPVFMAATPEFVAKSADTVVAYLKAWLDVARDFKDSPNKVADAIYGFYASKGYTMSQDTFRKALATVDVNPGFPSDLGPYMQQHADVLLKEKKIAAIPGLEQGAAPRLHGEGAVLTRRRAPGRTTARTGEEAVSRCTTVPWLERAASGLPAWRPSGCAPSACNGPPTCSPPAPSRWRR